MMRKECVALLKSGVRAVKSRVSEVPSRRFLNILKELESKDKKRVSILDFIELKLQKMNDEVAGALAKNKSLPPMRDPYAFRDTMEVEDSEDEEVVLTIGTDSLVVEESE
jgi:hypothetical protein